MDLKDLEEWLEFITKIQQVKLMITDRKNILYSYPTYENRGEELSEELKLYISNLNKSVINIDNNVFNIGELKKILKNNNEENYTAQMIAPIIIDNEIKGSIIFYRDITMKYVKQDFIQSKVESIKIAKDFIEKTIDKNKKSAV